MRIEPGGYSCSVLALDCCLMAAEILVIWIVAVLDAVKAMMVLRLPAWTIRGRQSAGALYKLAKFFQIGNLAPRLWNAKLWYYGKLESAMGWVASRNRTL